MKSLFILLLTLYSFQNIFSSYDPNKAVAYAEKWYNKRNPIYHDYSNQGGDCANFVSQCLIAGGFSTSGCEGNYGTGSTIPLVSNLEKCLVQKGWTKSYSIPAAGIPAGGVIAYNNGAHAVLVCKGGTDPLVAGHTNDVWMGYSNYGTRTFYWDPKATPGPNPPDGTINWFPYVNGYDTSDSNNGFAGSYGRAVVALKVQGATYKVHETGGKWLSAVKNNQVCGRGNPIDAIAIKGGVKYRVHIKGGSWLPAVTGYDTNDSENGYAGVLGRTIDAVAIHGKTYATGY